MIPNISLILIFIGIGCFTGSFVVWFWFYPKTKKLLAELGKEFMLEYPKGVFLLRRGKLNGAYRGREIIIVPFVAEKKLWILLKFSNPKDFLASIKPRKAEFFLTEPISKKGRQELFSGNSAFDGQFKVFGKTTLEITKILSPLIQERLIQLAKEEIFEIQILSDGIFYSSENKSRDVEVIKFVLDLLVDIAKNISQSS